MTMQRWNPFLRDFVSLRDAVDRLFEESFVHPDRLYSMVGSAARTMPLEIYETPDTVVVRALLPGVTQEDLDVQYQQGVLSLRARTRGPEGDDGWTWHLREFGYGEIARSVTLPKEVDADGAGATFADGILTLTLPKSEQAKPKQIRIAPGARIGAGSGG
jgi:HSP20 family protein